LPAPISLIDTEEKIRRALPALREMVSEGLTAMTDVEVLHHTSGEGKKRIWLVEEMAISLSGFSSKPPLTKTCTPLSKSGLGGIFPPPK
jgi:hypothetical protein